MTVWLVVWLSVGYDCPWGLGKAPEAVQGLLCQRRQSWEWLATSRADEVRRKVLELGPTGQPLILEWHGGRTRRAESVWEPRIK